MFSDTYMRYQLLHFVYQTGIYTFYGLEIVYVNITLKILSFFILFVSDIRVT